MPRAHPRSAASALHAVAEEGPVSSRIQSEEADCGVLDSQGDPGTRGGTAHRSVRWGRPSAQNTNFTAASAPGASAESAHGADVRPPDHSRAGRPLAVRHSPPLATPVPVDMERYVEKVIFISSWSDSAYKGGLTLYF